MKVLLLNCVYIQGSTGKIVVDTREYLIRNGIDTFDQKKLRKYSSSAQNGKQNYFLFYRNWGMHNMQVAL